MTNEEAAVWFEKILAGAKQGLEEHPEEGKRVYGMRKELAEIALSALRPVSRELVEQVWGGMWIYDPDTGYAYCEMCKHTICQTDYLNGKLPPFCEMCGAPMTDEAVQMVMERLEEL